MVRRTTGVALLAILCFSSLLATANAFDTARKLRDRALNGRVKRNTAQASLHSLARSGQYSVSQLHAVLDHILARRSGFEGYEHAYGSGYESGSDANAIKFKFIDAQGAVVDKTTADKVLLSQDGVDFSYSEMTAVAGDYWSVKDLNKNIICNLVTGTRTTAARPANEQATRFLNAFNDMWHNPDYGQGGKLPKYGLDGKELTAEAKLAGWMPHLEQQLRDMLKKEKDGVEAVKAADSNEIHPGSKWYEGTRPSGFETITQMAKEGWHAQSQKLKNVNAIGEGNWRALQYNDDHFWKCAQNTYEYGHKEAVKTAHAAGKTFADLEKRSPKVAASAYVGVANNLIKAYAMDGFVSHFLSDQFSSGHLRTPRVELRNACDGLSDGAKEAGLTANVMHDEDNWNCVLVKNKLGNLWWACGDHRFFDQENAMNRRMLHDAIAASVKSVSDAFEAGRAGKADPSADGGWVAAGLNYVGSTELLSKRQAAENTCPLFRIHGDANELQIRTSARTALPRPTKAANFAWGSSLRWKMKADAFPAFEDLAATRDMGQSDADFKVAMGNTYDGTDCAAYRAFTSRSALKSDDCCAVAGRSTPTFVADSSAFGDTEVKQKWAASAAGTNKDKRVSYVNECYVTQNAVATGNSIASAAKTAGTAVVDGTKAAASAVADGAKTVGNAVVNGAKAVGSAAVDGLVAYGEMMQHMGGLIY